jgi:hypothetical protein
MPQTESIATQLKAEVDATSTWRSQQLPKWQRNVEYRQNKVLDAEPDRDEVLVPIDWSRTRNKIAQLFFQVPKISLFPRAPQWRPVTPLVSAVVNHQLAEEMHVEHTVEEVLGDVINAAGIGVAYLSYEAEFVPEEVPAMDLSQRDPAQLVQAVQETGGQIPMITKQVPLYHKVDLSSVDPADFLFPLSHTKINWNKAPWLGHNFRLSDAEARRRNWLKDGDTGGGDPVKSVNTQREETSVKDGAKTVSCTRVFYRPYFYDPKEPDCRKIKVLIWVDGANDGEPVVHEDFKWQKYDATTKQWIGMTTFPLKPLKLTHISGQAIPPSDSEIGRPQVRELNKSRTQMLLQRDRSFPLRWYDVNLVDEDIVEQIRRGTWQDMIPTQGPGSNVIGEVSRASYPRESYEFTTVFEKDLDQAWSSGANQGGYEASGTTSATEAEITQKNFQVALEHQRAKVLAWFLEIAEGVLDLMQMFWTIEQYVPFVRIGGEKVLESWDKDRIPGKFVFSARPDAATRVDVGQKRADSLNRYKLVRQDPLANGQKLLADVFEAHDVDPTEAFAPPQPPAEPQPKVPSFSFRGEDLVNPMVVALIQKVTPITAKELQAARILMADAGIPVAPASMVPDTLEVEVEQPQQPQGGGSPPHPGITSEVTPLNRRYQEGSGDGSSMEQGMVGEGTGRV